jgi:hypothetical protein
MSEARATRVGEGDLTVEVRTTAERAEEAEEAVEVEETAATSQRNINPKHRRLWQA